MEAMVINMYCYLDSSVTDAGSPRDNSAAMAAYEEQVAAGRLALLASIGENGSSRLGGGCHQDINHQGSSAWAHEGPQELLQVP